MHSRSVSIIRVAYTVALLLAAGAAAQELEPRAYSASPTGANFVGIGFERSSGSVLFDPTIPLTDVHADISSPVLGIGRTFGLFGRQALATAALPYAFGNISGKVGPQLQPGKITRSGLADLRLKFSLNLHGSPALKLPDFARNRRRTFLLGTSLTVQAPVGQYDPAKLVNLGTNRWAFKPEVGVSYPVKKFYFDVYVGAWLFTENPRFFPGGNVRKQDPLTTLQAHASYTLRPHLWLAFDSTWYSGGAGHLNGGPSVARQNNSRLGATLSFPLSKRQSVKVAYAGGVSARTGSNFNTVNVLWQFLWFDVGRSLRP
jgi:Putative MetA-pathway of phenol degradation